MKIPANYKDMPKDTDIEDFFVAGYLALQVDLSQRDLRSEIDALKYGIARYHAGAGEKGMIRMAQKALQSQNLSEREFLSYSALEGELLKGGKKELKLVEYINEVVKYVGQNDK